MSRRLGALLLLCVLLVATSSAHAIPRYAARTGQQCQFCHTDPTGGGQRTLYASQFLVPAFMAARWLEMSELEEIPHPKLGERLLIGADLRTIYTGGEIPPGEAEGFFQMQTDLYLDFTLAADWELYMDRGASETRTSFLLAHVLPLDGYLKVGRFTPDFGWRLSDHTAFTREALAPPGHTDVGVELGAFPGPFMLTAALHNGRRGLPLDTDNRLASTGRAMWMGSPGPLRLGLGASYGREDDGRTRQQAGGPFAFAQGGRLSWLGELDWRESEPDGGASRTELVSSHELALQLVRGVDLLATLSLHDPEQGVDSGERRRYGLGIDSLVHPFLHLRAMWHRYDHDTGPRVRQPSRHELLVMVHALY